MSHQQPTRDISNRRFLASIGVIFSSYRNTFEHVFAFQTPNSLDGYKLSQHV
jgi:hypothetical protein